jgi:serpin B
MAWDVRQDGGMKHSLHNPSVKLVVPLLAGLAATAGCGAETPAPSTQGHFEEVRSSRARITAPQVSEADRTAFANGQRRFALDAYRALAAEAGNIVYSPHSIQVALSMTWAGARGRTESQMAMALRFALPQGSHHAAFNALDQELAARAARSLEGGGRRFQLRVTNALFGQRGETFLPTFLDTLAEHYGAGLKLLDFMADPEAARRRINAWVSEQTERRIPELLREGSVNRATTLVLTNAVYFNASWASPFDAAQTSPAPWHAPGAAPRMVPMMNRSLSTHYAEGEGWQAVELPYAGGDVAMLLMLPAEGRLGDFERELTAERLDGITSMLSERLVQLTMPTFSFRKHTSLKQLLQSLGMTDAFQGGIADLSGMNGNRTLFVQDVVHEGFIAVDERGTEAAAATAVVVGRTSIPKTATFRADRPFLFAIRDRASGTLLFLGRVASP